MNLELEVRRIGGNRLVREYVSSEGGAGSRFVGHWADAGAYAEKAAEVDARVSPDARARAALAMTPTRDDGRARLERWVEEGGYVVTTGQQPGLFTGPLYSIYKGLTAVRLAERLEEDLGRPVLPLYWVASEDHDWAEANHADVVGVDNELHRFSVAAPDGQEGRPLHRIDLDASVERVVSDLLEHLPDTDFSGDLKTLLTSSYRSGATLPSAFRDALGGLLGRFGLYVVDAGDPALKELSRPILAREAEAAAAHESLLAERAKALDGAGYPVQVPILEDGVNLFVEGPAGRERLYRDEDGFHLRHSGVSLSFQELTSRIHERPSEVSPNVLLRPVVEAAVFPSLAIVVGPGELSYFAQLAPYFEAFGVRPPVAHPRYGVTAVEAKIRKVLDKFELTVAETGRPFHELAADIARDEVPAPVRQALGEIRGAIGRGAGALTQAVKAVDPTLKGPVQHARSVSFDAWSDAERKIVQAVKRENEVALQQLEKACLHLHPGGAPQERVMNVAYYVARYGDAFLDDVVSRFTMDF